MVFASPDDYFQIDCSGVVFSMGGDGNVPNGAYYYQRFEHHSTQGDCYIWTNSNNSIGWAEYAVANAGGWAWKSGSFTVGSGINGAVGYDSKEPFGLWSGMTGSSNTPSGQTNFVYVAPVTNGQWEVVLTNALEMSNRLLEIAQTLQAISSNTAFGATTNIATQTTLTNLLANLERALVNPETGETYSKVAEDNFYKHVNFDGSDALRVNVNWEAYPGGEAGGVTTNILTEVDLTLSNMWQLMQGGTGWMTSKQGTNYFQSAMSYVGGVSESVFKEVPGLGSGSAFLSYDDGGSVFRDRYGSDVFRTDSGYSVFKVLQKGTNSVSDSPLLDDRGRSVFYDANGVSWFEQMHNEMTKTNFTAVETNGTFDTTEIESIDDEATQQRNVFENNVDNISDDFVSDKTDDYDENVSSLRFMNPANWFPNFGKATSFTCGEWRGTEINIDLTSDTFVMFRTIIAWCLGVGAVWFSCKMFVTLGYS